MMIGAQLLKFESAPRTSGCGENRRHKEQRNTDQQEEPEGDPDRENTHAHERFDTPITFRNTSTRVMGTMPVVVFFEFCFVFIVNT